MRVKRESECTLEKAGGERSFRHDRRDVYVYTRFPCHENKRPPLVCVVYASVLHKVFFFYR